MTQPAATGPVSDAVDVMDSMSVGFVALDPTWRMTHVNGAAERILGRPAAELIGFDLWERFPGARELEFGRVYEQVMTTRRPASFEAFYPGLDVWFELRVQPAEQGIVVFFLDVTARRRADERAALDAARDRAVVAVTQALTETLDVLENVGSLARLVVPFLGDWSIVSLVGQDGVLRDTGCWHADPARRADVERYRGVRLSAARQETFAAWAARTGRPVLLAEDDVTALRQRLGDGPAREVLELLRPRFFAALPMVARGRTVGLLSVYADQPWSADQRTVADDIVTRAALAIDNSLAYGRARDARAEAEAAGRRLSLLARVGEALATTDDPDEAVGRLARLVVPQLGDWSFVTIVDEDGALRDVGTAHRDPAREGDLAAYSAVHLQDMTDQAPVAIALHTGRPVVVPGLRDEVMAAFLPDPVVADLTRRLDPWGVAVFPLTAGGRTFGVLAVVTTSGRGAHTDEEVATAFEVARRAGPVLEAARSAQRARRLAETIQRSLLAVAEPAARLEVATRYRPAHLDREIGGDWYDVFGLPGGSTVVAIGDVMGHDVAAIAAMAQLRTLMRATAWTLRTSPAEILTATDDASFGLGPATFATAVACELLPPDGDGSVTMRWSSAGHLPPVVIEPDGTARLLSARVRDIPLGVWPGSGRHDDAVVLAPGSVVLLYTDGLVERRNRDLDAGLDELLQVLTSPGGHGPNQVLDPMLDQLLSGMSTGGPLHDDVALLAVRIPGVAAPTVELAPGLDAPAVARAWIAESCRELAEEVREDVLVVVSELVTNAVRHGHPPITLSAARTGGRLRVEVRDGGPGRPVLPERLPDQSAPDGRGLLIVAALAADWGVLPAEDGTVVWFEMATDPQH